MDRKYDPGIIWFGQTGRRHTPSPQPDDHLEITMSTSEHAPAIGLTSIPRAVLSVAYGVVSSVERAMVGDGHVRTSQTNAWEALCADRDRARRRAELRRAVAVLAAERAEMLRVQVRVGSSPRSSASQTSRVPAPVVPASVVPAGPAPAGPVPSDLVPAGPVPAGSRARR